MLSFFRYGKGQTTDIMRSRILPLFDKSENKDEVAYEPASGAFIPLYADALERKKRRRLQE